MKLAEYFRQKDLSRHMLMSFMDSYREGITGSGMYLWALDVLGAHSKLPKQYLRWYYGNEWEEFQKALKHLDEEDEALWSELRTRRNELPYPDIIQ